MSLSSMNENETLSNKTIVAFIVAALHTCPFMSICVRVCVSRNASTLMDFQFVVCIKCGGFVTNCET